MTDYNNNTDLFVSTTVCRILIRFLSPTLGVYVHTCGCYCVLYIVDCSMKIRRWPCADQFYEPRKVEFAPKCTHCAFPSYSFYSRMQRTAEFPPNVLPPWYYRYHRHVSQPPEIYMSIRIRCYESAVSATSALSGKSQNDSVYEYTSSILLCKHTSQHRSQPLQPYICGPFFRRYIILLLIPQQQQQQLTEDRGMMRRTPLFQELLFAMVNSPNPHEYGKDQRFKYRFGVFAEVSCTRWRHKIVRSIVVVLRNTKKTQQSIK